MSPEKFQELLARARANAANKVSVANAESLQKQIAEAKPHIIDLTNIHPTEDPEVVYEVLSDLITEEVVAEAANNAVANLKRVPGVARDVMLNTQQQKFLNLVVDDRKDVVLIGAAGTGKTTSMRRVSRALIDANVLPLIREPTKYLQRGLHGAAILAFTRKAANNIRHAVVEELKGHVLTIHKLLEFGPVFYEIEDPNVKGGFRKTMRFEPFRHATNPLPAELQFIAFEESSMIAVELYELLEQAMPHTHQEVFLGDIQQLPPIFGMAILGFKMQELEVVELTEIYRQALESPIIDLAWKILQGKASHFDPMSVTVEELHPITKKKAKRMKVPSLEKLSRTVELPDGTESVLRFQPWQKELSENIAILTLSKQFEAWEKQGYYNPNEDIILIPFNKGVGTIELNKCISQYMGRKRDAEVFEVIAGFNKHYLAVGDRVLFDKEDAFITKITRNGNYAGKLPQTSSKFLDRWGVIDTGSMTDADKLAMIGKDAADADLELQLMEEFLASHASGEDEARVQAASHSVYIRYAYQDEDDETEIVLNSAAEINALLGGYALTIYKFQGSEAENVFMIWHKSHEIANKREALYTGVTRARKFLHIICEKDTFYKGINRQAIKGDSIAEKAEFFKGKVLEKEKAREAARKEAERQREMSM